MLNTKYTFNLLLSVCIKSALIHLVTRMIECLTTPQHEKQIGYWVSGVVTRIPKNINIIILKILFIYISFFIIIILNVLFYFQEKMKGKNKLVPRLLGITKESVVRVDEKTKEVMTGIHTRFVLTCDIRSSNFILDRERDVAPW